ncbi:MAG TPA: V-type ATPase 116kDa subunit family protein [Anaerolineales bacterium]|nr:V-type ATPase 116kDa subunit family protein [Anaerolineales bacterium]
MTRQMAHVEIVGLKEDLETIVRSLHRFGRLQVDPLAGTPEIAARPLKIDEATRKGWEAHRLLLAQIEGALDALGGKSSDPLADLEPEAFEPDVFERARTELEPLAEQIERLINRRESDLAELASLPRYESSLRKLLPLLPEIARYGGMVTVGILISRSHAGAIPLIDERIQDLTGGRALLVSGALDADTQAVLIVFPERFAEDVEILLGREDVARLRLPERFGRGGPDAMLANLEARLRELPDSIAAIDRELDELGRSWCTRLAGWRAALKDRLEAFEVLEHLGETEHTFVIAGWIPADELAELERRLEGDAGPNVVVRNLPLTPAARKRAPVILENPVPARPFERLVSLFSTPAYGGLDPTRLMAIFLPFFFGMMLGDAGYGVLIVLLCLGLMRKFKTGFARDMLWVLVAGGAWTILFGLLFGEAFGTLGEHYGMEPLWLHRAGDEMTSLFLLTIAVGVAHVTLGLILGVWEAVKHRSRSHLLERTGMLVGIIALLALVAILAGYLPDGWLTPAAAALIVGIALLGAPMKWLGLLVGPIEFLGLIGNILSYLRIAAIGLASVYLAEVANEIAGAVGGIVVGVIIAVLIHTLNLALGIFSPTIHGLRLHYVEFFRKFYEGGGRVYDPFRSRLENPS